MQTIWGNIWKCTVEKSKTNASSAILHPQIWAISGHTWKDTKIDQAETFQRIYDILLSISIYLSCRWNFFLSNTPSWKTRQTLLVIPRQSSQGPTEPSEMMIWTCTKSNYHLSYRMWESIIDILDLYKRYGIVHYVLGYVFKRYKIVHNQGSIIGITPHCPK